MTSARRLLLAPAFFLAFLLFGENEALDKKAAELLKESEAEPNLEPATNG